MNIGLVLSGGVAKGAYQAGFLKALEEEMGSNHITSISCASIGLFSGYAFAAKKTDLLCDIWRRIHFDSSVDLAYEVWFKHYFKDLIGELVCKDDVLNIPVYAPICYVFPLIRMEYCKLYGRRIKNWDKFMLGAVSYPFLSGGVHFFRGQITFDGGVMDNIPVFPLIKYENPDAILILHFEAGYRPRRKYLLSGIPIVDYDISLNDIYRRHSFDFHGDTLLARLDRGYEYGKEICGKLFHGGENRLEEFCCAAERQKKMELKQRLDNITFETWVQRLNELFYPYVSHFPLKLRDLSAGAKKGSVRQEKKESELICR